ncbi:putative thiol methyltransferase 2 [Ceratocystis lukuohia]|uniref:Thiol methyltransferase 2 n=2 Tax=Ceratocystis TaxID=5157 RepID=A0ABR4MFJ7_9PEZI|nr:putative thiol methyltransferase 2 [Ceratocystis platani]
MATPPHTLAESFADLEFSQHIAQWDAFWVDGETPWDRAGASPALAEALGMPEVLVAGEAAAPAAPAAATAASTPRRKRALVPGCGRGYDVLLLASYGFDATGLDASPKAIAEAKETARALADDPAYALAPGVIQRGSVSWAASDFFAEDLVQALGGPFDLVYDYTFLCALPVAVRPRWAAQMARLLSPTGRLVCLEFPIGKPPATGGPPHGLQSSAYMALLSAPGAEVEYDEAGEAVHTSPGGGRGLRRVAYFKPKKTNAVGYNPDGSVRDNVSVWGY